MARSFTTIFKGVLPVPPIIWIKFVSLFKGVLLNSSKDPNSSNTELPNSSTSVAEPLPAAECILDIETLHFEADTISETPSSSRLSIHRTSPTIQTSSESLSSPKGLLPTFTRNSTNPQSTDVSSGTNQPRKDSSSSNPIARVFQDQDLGKTIIGFLMPITAAFLTPLAPTSGLLRMLIFLSLSLGLAALWNGILLRQILPRHATTIEQIGAALVLLAFYGLISSFLPDYILWIPCFCFLLIIFPFFWSYHLDRVPRR